jgi:hypothetical protein
MNKHVNLFPNRQRVPRSLSTNLLELPALVILPFITQIPPTQLSKNEHVSYSNLRYS